MIVLQIKDANDIETVHKVIESYRINANVWWIRQWSMLIKAKQLMTQTNRKKEKMIVCKLMKENP